MWKRVPLEEDKAFLTCRDQRNCCLLEKVGERFGDLGEVFNEAAAITCQTEEASDLLDDLQRKPKKDCLDGFRIDGEGKRF